MWEYSQHEPIKKLYDIDGDLPSEVGLGEGERLSDHQISAQLQNARFVGKGDSELTTWRQRADQMLIGFRAKLFEAIDVHGRIEPWDEPQCLHAASSQGTVSAIELYLSEHVL